MVDRVLESELWHRYHWYDVVGVGPPATVDVAVTGTPNWVEPDRVSPEMVAARAVNQP